MLFVEIFQKVKSIEKRKGLIKIDELVVIVAGSPDFKDGSTNLMMAEKTQ